MGTKLLALCCVALLALAGCGDSDDGGAQPGPEDPNGDATGGGGNGEALPDDVVLAFTPPGGWKNAMQAPNSKVVIHYPPGSRHATVANMHLLDESFWMPKEKNLAGAVKSYVDSMKHLGSIVENYTVVSSETVQIGDVTAQEINFTSESYGGVDLPFKGRTWIGVSKSDVWQLLAVFETTEFDENEPLIEAAGSSLRWEAAPEGE